MVGDDRFMVTRDGKSSLAYAVSNQTGTWVFLDGHAFIVDPPAAARRGARGDDQTALTAPMPATVMTIAVQSGQQVKAGDTLILLEAMKMELAIKAPRDARVTRIACAAGDLVQPGVPLVELE
jgi:3-methylcrotonyl-CoA carboxylase alpha subunit